MERFEEAVPLYLKACEVEGKTERTVQSYAETLRHFIRAVDQLQLPNSVRAFGPAHVYLFMGWVRDRGVSAGTQHRRQREVKAFFSWCRRMDYVEENPFMRVPMVRREQKVVQPFSKEDITTLLAACNPESYVGSRMRAMILFLLDTGVRSSELVSIHLDDVLFDQHRVRVLQGKGRKQRWTAISDVALEALRGYLDGLPGLVRRAFVPDGGRAALAQSPHERDVYSAWAEGRGETGESAPVPAHVCHLGDTSQCTGAGRAVPPWALEPNDGEALLCHLRLRAGGECARDFQPCDAASWRELGVSLHNREGQTVWPEKKRFVFPLLRSHSSDLNIAHGSQKAEPGPRKSRYECSGLSGPTV